MEAAAQQGILSGSIEEHGASWSWRRVLVNMAWLMEEGDDLVVAK